VGPKRPRSAMAPTAMTTLRSRIRRLLRLNFCEDLRDHGEHALVDGKHKGRDTGGTHGWLASDVHEGEVLEVTNVSIVSLAERERVTPEEPLGINSINGRQERGLETHTPQKK